VFAGWWKNVSVSGKNVLPWKKPGGKIVFNGKNANIVLPQNVRRSTKIRFMSEK